MPGEETLVVHCWSLLKLHYFSSSWPLEMSTTLRCPLLEIAAVCSYITGNSCQRQSQYIALLVPVWTPVQVVLFVLRTCLLLEETSSESMDWTKFRVHGEIHASLAVQSSQKTLASIWNLHSRKTSRVSRSFKGRCRIYRSFKRNHACSTLTVEEKNMKLWDILTVVPVCVHKDLLLC